MKRPDPSSFPRAAASVLILLLVVTLMIISVGAPPGPAFSGFFRAIFASAYGFCEVLVRATPLIFTGLGVSLAFRTGFINIGAEGQLYAGAIAASAFALTFPTLPSPLMLPLLFAAAFGAGGIWSLIPGLLKARWGIPEIINTIMFNYIALSLTGILVRTVLKDSGASHPMSPPLPPAAALPPLLEPTRLHAGFALALLAALCVYALLFRTPRGFQMRAVGLNARAARCSGIHPGENTALSAFLSGALSGLAGAVEVAALHHRLLEGISANFGYTAIIVALLGRQHPAFVVAAALGLAALQTGSRGMERAGVPTAIAQVIMGLTVILLLARPFARRGAA